MFLSFLYCITEYYYLQQNPNAIFIGMLLFATISITVYSKKIIELFRDNIEMYINIYMGDTSENIQTIQKK